MSCGWSNTAHDPVVYSSWFHVSLHPLLLAIMYPGSPKKWPQQLRCGSEERLDPALHESRLRSIC